MNKRDFVLSLLSPSYTHGAVPAAFFLHFDEQFRRGRAAIDKHLEFFRFTGMDIVKIQFELPMPHVDIASARDWEKLPQLDRDFFAPQLEVVKGLVSEAKREALVILTLYSSFMLANQMTDADVVTRAISDTPDAFKRGIGRITDNLLAFVRECIRMGLDGFYTSTQGGEAGHLADPSSFDECVRPYDLAVMDAINEACEFSILHVCDYHLPYSDLSPFSDYPGQVVNTPLELAGGKIGAREVAKMFGRPFMGGLERKGVIAKGTPEQIRTAVREAIAGAPDRYILGADCTVPADTPWENLRIAIEASHANRE
ncbi:MAG TPA: uroporphyrinogen decarboxylase family protein [Spirochaetia bacterium]|nr:uroporphyrinogen decarboxylase family protein [Spirochaetia bacterium]